MTNEDGVPYAHAQKLVDLEQELANVHTMYQNELKDREDKHERYIRVLHSARLGPGAHNRPL
jgi:hypothetical protein